MNITYCSSQVVHCVITSKGSEESFACSILYASNDAHIIKMAWKDFFVVKKVHFRILDDNRGFQLCSETR